MLHMIHLIKNLSEEISHCLTRFILVNQFIKTVDYCFVSRFQDLFVVKYLKLP